LGLIAGGRLLLLSDALGFGLGLIFAFDFRPLRAAARTFARFTLTSV